MATLRSFQELMDIYIAEVRNGSGQLTDFNEGSINDDIAGASVTAVHEAMQLIADEFLKTFFDTAHGPEVTGGPDDLQTLAVDQYGESFARPVALHAEGVVTFSRPNADEGNILIPAGTIVKAEPDANGNIQSFETLIAVTMVGTSINASVKALEAGVIGNVEAEQINVIDSTLDDPSITVLNALGMTGGAEQENDAAYRLTIRRKILELGKATKTALVAAAEKVSGVVKASVVETYQTVIEWDIGSDSAVGDPFRIPSVVLYVTDANGTADDDLIASVRAAIEESRAAGVYVDIRGTVAYPLDWTAEITLNVEGPNFLALSADAQPIEDTMKDYLDSFGVGDDFVRTAAESFVMATWGPSGTDDLVSFTTVSPVGDIEVPVGSRIISGTMEIA